MPLDTPGLPSGNLRFDSTGELVGPGTCSSDFAQLRIAASGEVRVGPDRTEMHYQRESLSGGIFTVAIGFVGPRLGSIELFLHRPGDEAGWEGWSEQSELQRKADQEAWIECTFGRPLRIRPVRLDDRDIVPADTPAAARHAEFEWGEVASFYDDKGGNAFVRIRYNT